METKYYSCKEREDLMKVISFEGTYYENDDFVIDIVGKRNLNELIELQEDEIDEREPTWSNFLFNVRFKRESDLFDIFKEETPKTPFRTFF